MGIRLVITSLLVLVISPDLQANITAVIWHDFKLAGGHAVPYIVNFKRTNRHQGCALVRAREVSRKVVAYRAWHENKSTDSEPPARVDLKYRVMEVYSGHESLIGKPVYATGVDWQHARYAGDPFRFEGIPNESDEGILLVKNVEGKLQCVDLHLMRIDFPVFESNVRSTHAVVLKRDYRHVLELAKEIKKAKTKARGDVNYWLSSCHSPNHLIATRATYVLARLDNEVVFSELKSLCQEPSIHPLAQSIADEKLVRSRHNGSWRTSSGRKKMLERWLALEDENFYFTLVSCVNQIVARWKTHGYEATVLRQQLAQAVERRDPKSKEHRYLLHTSGYFEKMMLSE